MSTATALLDKIYAEAETSQILIYSREEQETHHLIIAVCPHSDELQTNC